MLQLPKMDLFLTENRGWGVKAAAPIPKGAFIVEYAGVLAALPLVAIFSAVEKAVSCSSDIGCSEIAAAVDHHEWVLCLQERFTCVPPPVSVKKSSHTGWGPHNRAIRRCMHEANMGCTCVMNMQGRPVLRQCY